jgi:hypothetical protein
MVLVQHFAGIYMPDRWPLILGILYVLCVMFLRGGFARYLTSLWYWVGDRLFAGYKPTESVTDKDAKEEVK